VVLHWADGKVNRDAAWYYPHLSPAASEIAGHMAFWRGVRVKRVPGTDGEAAGSAGRGLDGRIRGRLRRAGARP
jgi:hypothetical protein